MRIWLIVLLAGSCASTPPCAIKTERVEVKVPGPVQIIPAVLSADCAPAPLKGTTIGSLLDRLSSVENALQDCRGRLSKIRALH